MTMIIFASSLFSQLPQLFALFFMMSLPYNVYSIDIPPFVQGKYDVCLHLGFSESRPWDRTWVQIIGVGWGSFLRKQKGVKWEGRKANKWVGYSCGQLRFIPIECSEEPCRRHLKIVLHSVTCWMGRLSCLSMKSYFLEFRAASNQGC